MANRIDDTFARLRAENRKGFVAYITAGDPNLDATRELALCLEKSGVDVLELGIPFSDPLADGAVNQAAAQRALEAGATVPKLLETIRKIREESQLPIVLFTYLNPLYVYGFEKFHQDAAAAGVDGILVLDLPPEEARANAELAAASGLKAIRLIAPTSPPERIREIAQSAEGFIYYVSREGVTGEQTKLSDTISSQVAEIKKHTDLPIAVGFGISTPEQAAEVAASADAVVVGSAIVRRIAEKGTSDALLPAVQDFATPIAKAIHAA